MRNEEWEMGMENGNGKWELINGKLEREDKVNTNICTLQPLVRRQARLGPESIPFSLKRGFRQDCPLSGFVFISSIEIQGPRPRDNFRER